MISVAEAKKIAKKNLSAKRYAHTLNVKKLAVLLAKANKVDPERAALAALLHDIAKEEPKEKLLRIFADNDIMAKDVALRPVPVWHGVAASILAKTKYGVEDEGILSAISCHTTGKENMSVLDKIIYMADMTSEERTYSEAESLRKLTLENLDEGIIEGLGASIRWLKEEGKNVDGETLAAWKSLRKMYYGGEEV